MNEPMRLQALEVLSEDAMNGCANAPATAASGMAQAAGEGLQPAPHRPVEALAAIAGRWLP